MEESYQAKSLCQGFNGISVRQGDTFKIELYEGGRAGITYAVDVVQGNAELIAISAEPSDELTLRTFTFRAGEAGKVEVTAQATICSGDTFSPNRYMLRVR